MEINYLSGHDVREPYKKGEVNLILHCCNDQGAMGAGVAKALFDKWPEVRIKYMEAFNKEINNQLGDIHYVKVE